jgi:carbon-monoxide dehydrogenase small subunit
MTIDLAFTLNGAPQRCTIPPERLLVDLLRDELDVTGPKVGCAIGVCGACSVLVDGMLMTGCLLPAVFVQGKNVTTVEGLAVEGELTPLQDAFIAHGGFQCGICTPGQLIASTALLAENPHPSRAEITDYMMGNLCRCTGYAGIVASIEAVAAGSAK